MRPDVIRVTAIALLCAVIVTGCGGGGGGDTGNTGGSGNGGGNTAITYSVTLTDVALTDSRTGEAVDLSGLPIQGATVTKD